MNESRGRRLGNAIRLVLLFAGLVCSALYILLASRYPDPNGGEIDFAFKLIMLSVAVGVTLAIKLIARHGQKGTGRLAALESETTEELIQWAQSKEGRVARSILANRCRNGDETARAWFYGEMPSGFFDDQIRVAKRIDKKLRLLCFRVRRHRHRSLRLHFYRPGPSWSWLMLSSVSICGSGLLFMQLPKPFDTFGIVVIALASHLTFFPFDRHWIDSSLEELTDGELYALWIEGEIRSECESVLGNRYSNQAIWIRRKLCL